MLLLSAGCLSRGAWDLWGYLGILEGTLAVLVAGLGMDLELLEKYVKTGSSNIYSRVGRKYCDPSKLVFRSIAAKLTQGITFLKIYISIWSRTCISSGLPLARDHRKLRCRSSSPNQMDTIDSGLVCGDLLDFPKSETYGLTAAKIRLWRAPV